MLSLLNQNKMNVLKLLSLGACAFLLGLFLKSSFDEKVILSNFSHCNATKLGQTNPFDLAVLANSLDVVNYSDTSIVLYELKANKLEKIFSYNEATNTQESKLDAESATALKAMISPDKDLYQRWKSILFKPRTQFLEKRKLSLENLQKAMPRHTFRVTSDIREAANQAALVKKGASTAPLSMHQFGLASDIAMYLNGRYLTDFTTYREMGLKAEEQELTWGGRFVGFIDPGHIQYYKNSAKMLSALPQLAFEFSPFLNFYKERVHKFEKAGKAKQVEDTAELIEVLEAINQENVCACGQVALNAFSEKWQKALSDVKYAKELALVLDKDSQKMYVFNSTKGHFVVKLGQWE
jgi:hypothetical protein